MARANSNSADETTERVPWHALAVDEVVARLSSDATAGLSDDDARRRLERHGRNALREPERQSTWAVFLRQFRSPLIYLLLVAGAVAFALGHTTDGIVICVVVLLNSLIGAFQEGRAARSLESLRKLARHGARVVRGGRELAIDAVEVVPGDLIVLDAGDAVAADARLIETASLQVAEAALTGESVPVTKNASPAGTDAALADHHDMVYAGTHVTSGRARAVVVATGTSTEIGEIAALAETAVEPQTPLERRVAEFGKAVTFAAAGMLALVLAIGWVRGLPFGEILMIGISQVVGMIPEGLPVAMSIALAIGVQRMARRNAVVRRLAAVETLGSTTVICTDKTGTLTKNEMTVTTLAFPGGRRIAVSGVGYEPQGRFVEGERELDASGDAPTLALLEACALCNDAELQGPEATEPRWRPIGDPTEVALLTVARKAKLDVGELRARWPREAELPFDSAAKLMATQHLAPFGTRVIVKGAPEAVLDLCGAVRRGGEIETLSDSARRAVAAEAEAMAAEALRVLAVAEVDGAEIDERGFEGLRDRAVLLGFVGQIDPPRSEVPDAVRRCREAGIRPVVVTGDHKATGVAIARTLGLADGSDLALDGRELEATSEAELERELGRIAVFARVRPVQKLRIVEAYQRRGDVVAMTGDGVNDAPALVQADVGVAMGASGTEVAKEAAKIVLADDNFATIVAAVEEGRVVYRNIKKAVLLLVSTSAAEVIVLFAALALGYPPPFAAVQILWNNLVTEGLITVNLAMEPPEGDEMRQRPISPGEPLLTRVLLSRMAVMVPAIVVATLGWFVVRTAAGVPEAQVRTETFTLLAICEWFNVLNCRSERRSALDRGLLRNRWLVGGLVTGNLVQFAVVFWEPLGRVFHTVPFRFQEFVALGAVGSLVLWAEELRKLVARRRERRL